jgi:biopolymer transport protein ExbD
MVERDTTPLSAVDIARIRRLSQPKETAPGEGEGEINVVPFLDIITNVMMFVLATLPAVFTATLVVTPPAQREGGRGPDPLNLALVVIDGGVAIKVAGGGIGPGCVPGEGVAVPKRGADHDWAAVRSCVSRIKDANVDFAHETEIKIMAEPGVAYQTVVAAMDAVRQRDDGEPLFPDVSFAIPR